MEDEYSSIIDQIEKKHKIYSSDYHNCINTLIKQIDISIKDISDDNKNIIDILNPLRQTFHDMNMKSTINNDLRDLSSSVKELGSKIQKQMSNTNLEILCPHIDKNMDQKSIRLLIIKHIFRMADIEIFEKLKDELKIEGLDTFSELLSNIDSLKKKDYVPLLNWLKSLIDSYEKNHAFFLLFRIVYLQKLQDENIENAMNYIKENFTDYCVECPELNDLKILCGYLLLSEEIKNDSNDNEGSYHGLLSNRLKEFHVELYDYLINLFLKYNSNEDYDQLELIVNASLTVIPTLSKYISVVDNKVSFNDRLPIPIDLPSKFQFHSIFVCPVTKEPTSKTNPPVLLKCGHIISKDAMDRMLSVRNFKFKCPTCPIESHRSDVLEINL